MEKPLDFQLFDNISAEEQASMLQCLGAVSRDYQKNEFIFLEGDQLDCIGVVVRGIVRMVKEDVWGQKSILLALGPGELFGESFACGAQAGSIVSFQAAAPCSILLLNFRRVLRTCTTSCIFHHRLIENMVSLLARKNVQLMEKMEIVSKKTLRERVFVWMSQQAQKQGAKKFQSPMGRLELAEYLCVDRSALTRELNRMEQDGILHYDKNVFELLSPAAIR